MFPLTLDGAKVLYYTPKGDYGDVRCTDGEICGKISYFVVCQYENDVNYYLFGCDASFNVITDTMTDSAEECKKAVKDVTKDVSWITR